VGERDVCSHVCSVYVRVFGLCLSLCVHLSLYAHTLPTVRLGQVVLMSWLADRLVSR
jgi:hypothetical protein